MDARANPEGDKAIKYPKLETFPVGALEEKLAIE